MQYEKGMKMESKDIAERRLIKIRPRKQLFNVGMAELWRYRELLYFLVWRELKVRYKQAVLGVAWVVLQPIIAVLIFTAIFGYFARIPTEGVPYAVFAFTALIPWTYFASALQRGGMGLVEDSDLVRKVYFPRLIIPLAMVTAPLVDFLLSFVILLAVLAWYGITPTINVLFLPLFMLLAVALAIAVVLWLGPVNVRFRDIKHTLPFLVQVWMYASPVVYPVSMIPERWQLLYSLNPMVGVIEGFRWALLGKQDPNFDAMLLSGCIVLVILLGGIVYFRRMERFFADVI
jgi:lipopolysaccharide transport system permease protein